MESGDAARALAKPANEVIIAIRLGHFLHVFQSCCPCADEVRIFNGAAWHVFVAPMEHASQGDWTHWLKLLLLLEWLLPQSLSSGVCSAVAKYSMGGGWQKSNFRQTDHTGVLILLLGRIYEVQEYAFTTAKNVEH